MLTERRAFQPYGLMGKWFPLPPPPQLPVAQGEGVCFPPTSCPIYPISPLTPPSPPHPMSLTSLPPGPLPPCLFLQGVSPVPGA